MDWGRQGGLLRAAHLSQRRRSDIARQAVRAREAKRRQRRRQQATDLQAVASAHPTWTADQLAIECQRIAEIRALTETR